MSEIWLEVPGFGGWYEASNLGGVRSWRVRGNPTARAPYPHSLSQRDHEDGHPRVALVFDGREVRCRVSRLVLLTFVGEPAVGDHGRHRNEDPFDNTLRNLYWGAAGPEMDRRVAIQRAYAVGNTSYSKLARRFGVAKSTVQRAVTMGQGK